MALDKQVMQPTIAYTAVIHPSPHVGYLIGMATRGEPGYYPRPTFGFFDSWDAASDEAERLNREELGLDDEQAMKIVLSSMGAGKVG